MIYNYQTTTKADKTSATRSIELVKVLSVYGQKRNLNSLYYFLQIFRRKKENYRPLTHKGATMKPLLYLPKI